MADFANHLISALIAVAIVAAMIVAWRAWRTATSLPVRYTVVAHTMGGTSIRGVLVEQAADAIVLRAAAVLSESGAQVAADGDVVIARDNLDFIQRLDAAEAYREQS